MKYLFAFLFLFAGITAKASDEDVETSFGSRYSLKADYKISPGTVVHLGNELRFDKLWNIDRNHASVSVSHKINDYLKTELHYIAISVNKGSFYNWRHRGAIDLTGSYSFGDFKLSLRERLQGTHYTGKLNHLEHARNQLVLRSRIKLDYSPEHWKIVPSISLESRHLLNGAKWDAKSVSDDFILSGYEGFSDVYMNRLRTQAGVNYDLSDRHSIEVYGIYDYLRDKDIKASEELSRLENRIFMDLSRKFIFGLSYKFTF